MQTSELLKSLGLLTYESEVYAALLRLDRARVKDLAKIVAVPTPQIYVALRALAERGLCRESRGNVNYYSAIPPGVAFRGTLKREEKMLKEKLAGLRRLDEVHRKVERTGVPPQFVQVLKGPHVRLFIDEQVAAVKREVLIFVKSIQEQGPRSLEGGAKAELSLLERGVRVRCLYEKAAFKDGRLIPFMRRMLAAGEAGRVVATVPMNLMIFDDRAALFTLTTETGDTTVYVFAHWDLIAIMKSSLEHFWEHGENLRTALRKSSAPESSARGGKEIAHGEDKE